jgi:hypothetical protein
VVFLFAGAEEQSLIRMHPEFIVCDTTLGTNNTIKEMFTVAIKDGNNLAFFAARAYIPNSHGCLIYYSDWDCPNFGQELLRNV